MKKSASKNKTKTKKKVPRVKLVREESIDFILDTPEQAKEVCAHLAQLEATIGWLYLKKMLQGSIAVIEQQIIDKKDAQTGEKLTDLEVDELRMSHKAYSELINKPSQLIENIMKGNVPSSPEYDPYARGIKMQNENFAGVLEDEE